MRRTNAAVARVGLISCVLALGVLHGCASNRESAFVSPDVDLVHLRKFYVVRSGADERGVNGMIASELTKLGFDASTGSDESAPKEADAIVTYQDRWQWDMTVYMLELRILLRQPQTGRLLAMGTSFHTSLTRKSAEEMTAEVLSNIFRAKKAP